MILRGVISAARRSIWTARGGVTTATIPARRLGAVVPSKPIYYHTFGMAKVLIVSAPFIYLGAHTAKFFASYLEDLDLFVPDDDDDD